MGVHGLWQLLQPAGQQVTLESLRGKILAIDVSMWLHQSMKGMRDKHGQTAHNAHLQFLFKRVSKLLFYGIKPVFVFDGGVPLLKLQTIAGRRHKREDARANKEKTAKKLLQNVLKHHAVNAVLGNGSQANPSMPPSQRERDMFELPDLLPETDRPTEDDINDDWDDQMEQRQEIFSEFQNLNDVDVESEDFKALPPEIQHEVLSDLRDSRKHNSWASIDRLPTDSDDFSAFQMQKLMKQSKLSRKIETVRKELNTYHSGTVGEVLNDDDLAAGIVSNKVLSDDTTHYILVKRLSPMKNREVKGEEKQELGMFPVDSNDSLRNRHEQSELMIEDYQSMETKELTHQSSDRTEKYTGMKGTAIVLGTSTKNVQSVMTDTENTSEEEEKQTLVNLTDTCLNDRTSEIHDESDKSKNIVTNHLDTGRETFVEENSGDLVETQEVKHSQESLHNHVNLVSAQNLKRLNDPLLTTEKRPRLDFKIDAGEQLVSELDESSYKDIPVIRPDHQKEDVVEPEKTDSSEDDDDFLEVTINPGDIDSTDLFPASLFTTTIDDTSAKAKPEKGLDDNADLLPSLKAEKSQDIDENVPQDTGNSNIHSDWKNPFKDMSKGDLEDMQNILEEESASLVKERGTQERLASSITDQMQKESQELLLLFGVPFVESPMEAEAQCAFLDLTNQTHGTVTDDSDIWLFGGKRVYRNFFNQNKYVEYFSNKEIEDRLLLTRHQLVKLAYLCGCDYTDGIQGVGPVHGLEIMLEFPGDKLEGLNNLKDWWTVAHKQVKSDSDTKLKSKLKTLELSEGFPNPAVYEAFMEPVVDDTVDEFTWGKPDLDLLREFAYDKLGWTKAKVDDIILPVVKEMNKNVSQSNITSFFNIESVSKSPVKSKRVKRVLTRLKDNNMSVVEGRKGKSSKKLPAKNKKGMQRNKIGGGWVKEDDQSSTTAKGLNLSENSSESD